MENSNVESKEPKKVDVKKEKKLNFFTNLTKIFEEWKRKKEEKAEALPAKTKEGKKGKKVNRNSNKSESKAYIYNPYNWVKRIFFWSNIQVFIVVLATIIVWGVLYMIKDRELVVIDVKDNIQQQIFGYYKQNDMDRDSLESFIIGRLVIMRSFDYNGQPNLYLLQGTVSPDIISSVQEKYEKDRIQIEESGLVHVLAPPTVETIFMEELGSNKNQIVRRAEVYVKGYLVVTSLKGGRGLSTRIIPYRAQLSVIRNPMSRMNKDGYYIVQISEVSGEDNVKRFDELLSREKERRGIR